MFTCTRKIRMQVNTASQPPSTKSTCSLPRKKEAREYLDWFLPVWAILSEDDRFVLENFFLGEGSQDERVAMIGDHFYIQRDSVYRRKNRALDRLVTALYGRR